jgi:superfamily II DNA or RNA helicase
MPRIIDNISLHLRPTLQETLEHSARLDAAVGYFNLRGWSAVSDQVDLLPADADQPSARVLIGMQDRPDGRLRDELSIARRSEMVDNATANRLRQVAAAELRKQLTWGVPTAKDERTLRVLRHQLASGRVRVKLFLRHNLHAKLYLCHRSDPVNPRIGFVGSSNLTFSGLGGQGELNVDVLDHDATEKLAEWFQARWDDRFSLDITEELIEILDDSWAAERVIEPYLIHLKVAYHLSRDARAGLVEFGLPESMQRKLLEYQSAAVRITARNLMSRGGAMVGDVVGLGKTIVATAVALVLQEEQGFETLIICPRNLVTMWEGYVGTYRLHARVVSLSMVHKELEDLRRYRLVIIDESHNLRNPKRRDYAVIRDYISLNDPRVLLLTATPFNTSMSDVASQLGLFVEEDQDLGVRPEAAIARMGEIEFLARCDDKPSTLRAFALSEESEDWQRLLAQFLIRRTRRFIRDNYAFVDPDTGRSFLVFGTGEKNYLPDRLPKPLPFETSASDPASDMASLDSLRAIDDLRLPRYDLSRFVDPAGPNPNPDEKRLLDDIARAGGNLLGFTRTMLMKRLSSSGAVFLLSLQRHLLRNHMYLAAIRDDAFLPVGSVDDTQIFGDTSDVLSIPLPDDEDDAESELRTHADWVAFAGDALDALSERDPKNVTWVRSNLFTEALAHALEHDNAIIEQLLGRFGDWDHRRDSKLDALELLLTEEHPNEKVLIFSEYADTATYVANALAERGIARLASVTGNSDDPTRLARRFSPRSNAELGGRDVAADEELRVLVATDVLSEGQNLQDSAIVVNFDLPWAIIKLIQRAGRVDRIGQQADNVLVYTFLPTEGVEAVLRLRARVAERLARNASVFGSDERFLNTPGEANLIKGLFDENGEFPEGDDAEQVDYASAAYEIWRSAEERFPELAQRAVDLPNVTFATQLVKGDGRDAGVLVYTLSNFGVDRIGYAPVDGSAGVRLSPLEALDLTACEPDTPGLHRLDAHHDLVQAVIAGPLSSDDYGVEGLLTGVRRRVYERIRSFLAEASGQLFSPEENVQEAVDALYRSPLTEQAKQSLARAMRERTPEDVLLLVVQLHEESRLTIDVSSEPDDIHIVCSMGFSLAADES